MSSSAGQSQPSAGPDQPWPGRHSDYPPPELLQECRRGVSELHSALGHLDEAGTHFTESMVGVLEHTAYKCVGHVLGDRLKDVFTCAASKANLAVLGEIEGILSGLVSVERQQFDLHSFEQTLCHMFLLFTWMKKEYFTLCQSKMTELVHALLCLKGDDRVSGEITKLILKLGLADGLDSPSKANASLPSSPWGSPKLRKSDPDSGKASHNRGGFRIMSLFDRKTPPSERKSSFYAEVEPRSVSCEPPRVPAGSMTVGSHIEKSYSPAPVSPGPGLDPFSHLTSSHRGQGNVGDPTPLKADTEGHSHGQSSSVPIIVSSKSQLATEEELESVINLLSGVGCGSVSPMPVISEIPQGCIQLTVPQIYRTVSPVSDTQLDQRRKSQVHRRSEGCLDLSGVGHNMWPHQHQLHHRASLPSVQIFSATGQRSGFDLSSPVPPYIRDSPSPNYSMRDSPSPGYFRGDPPSPFRAHYANTLGVNMGGVRPNMLSPIPWGTCPPGSMPSARFGLDPGLGHHGTWPAYGGMSPVSPSPGDSSSWMGIQDCSDLSDDSSTEDQFFTVGKDLSHMIGSKDGSSDEEVDSGPAELAKSSSTWPPPSPHGPVNINRGLIPEFLEPPEVYNLHKPIQMQWSDPLSSRSVWQPTEQDPNTHKASQSMQGFPGPQ